MGWLASKVSRYLSILCLWLQREIKSASAKRSESNRDLIREGLTMSFSDETDCTSTACPPRTADKSGRMESKQARRSGKCDDVTRNYCKNLTV